MLTRFLGVSIVAFVLASCGGPGVLGASAAGTVSGHVLIRACGGAARDEPTPCPTRAVSGAVLTFLPAGSASSSKTTTDSAGAYRLDLQPGVYTVDVTPGGNYSKASGPRQVTVTGGKTVTADFTYVIQLL